MDTIDTERTIQVWWSPVAQCWLVEDGEMRTYFRLDDLVQHVQACEATVQLPLVLSQADSRLRTALVAAGVRIADA